MKEIHTQLYVEQILCFIIYVHICSYHIVRFSFVRIAISPYIIFLTAFQFQILSMQLIVSLQWSLTICELACRLTNVVFGFGFSENFVSLFLYFYPLNSLRK